MRVIVAGSRTITDYEIIAETIEQSPFVISEIVHGCCRGVDQEAEKWAKINNITIQAFPADWNTHGKAAGPIRNEAMSNYAEALIAIYDGTSRGTRDMINKALDQGLHIFVKVVK